MSPHYSEFNNSPLKARLNYQFGYFFAHLMTEKEASWGHEFKKAFKFRLGEYFREGRIKKTDPDLIPQDQGKQFRTINLEYEQKVIATVTLYYPEQGQSWKIIESGTRGNQKWKDFFYANISESIEIKNLVIHPEFRGTDVIMRVFAIIHRELVRSKRKYLITSCVDSLVSKYEQIAFKKTGLSYFRDYGRSDELHLLYSCQYALGAYGLHVGPLKWGVYLSKVSQQISHEYPHGCLQKFILGCYGLLSPISLSLYYMTVYLRWFKWEHKQSNWRKVSYRRYFQMLGLL